MSTNVYYKNKLTTQSYFIKRLKDSGYVVWKIFDNYSEIDPRAWTIMIDPGVASVFCTCYIEQAPLNKDCYFEIYDGGQYVPQRLKIKTDSIEVFITYLVQFGINNKSSEYQNMTQKKGE